MLTPGTRLGPYEILSPLGAGGMGEVYRARDTRLGREVALKVLPESFARDPDRVRRFESEARSASALADPHVVTVFDVGEQDGTPYIATELVEGTDLRSSIEKGPLPPGKAAEIAGQIAEGLAVAHDRGIVHRDLKPENVLIARSGLVKIADFGLAKRMGDASPQASQLATAAADSTAPGLLMGTVAYMSPEQARGEKVDFRSDQFAFGLMLYEMLTGRRAFARASPAETLSAILRDEPAPLATVAPDATESFAGIVDRCLAKDPEGRYGSTRDLAHDLRKLAVPSLPLAVPKPPPRVPRPAIAAALVVAAIVAAAAVLILRRPAAHSSGIDSLAILPFANSSGKPDMDFLSDGITESVINKVSQVSGLRVISRTSAFHYKGKEIEPEKVGRELNVRALLTGHVLAVGDALQVGAELVDARDGRHIWGDQYDRKMSDIFSMQTEIASEIATALRGRLTGQEQVRIEKRPTHDLAAYQAYLKGKYFFGRSNPGDLEKARVAFEDAVSRDPNFALAHVGIAGCYGVEASASYRNPAEAWPKSRAEAERAIALDESVPDAHTALAAVLLNRDWSWAAAEKELKRAMVLGPVDISITDPNDLYSFYLAAMGRLDEAVAAEKTAQRTDPLSPFLAADLAEVYYYAREFDLAIREGRRALELQPDSAFGLTAVGLSLVLQGKADEGIPPLRSAVDASGAVSFCLGNLGWAYGRSGRIGEAKEILRRMEAAPSDRYTAPLDRAMVRIGLAETDAAFLELDRAVEERNAFLVFLNVEPMFDPIRGDPRFAKLVARIGLPSGKTP
ncbi:MAG TPA: protein kinase [Thermoanaerobaculia bacterium]|nr:protein kinase [Thermoanaerobaculia bacterium]